MQRHGGDGRPREQARASDKPRPTARGDTICRNLERLTAPHTRTLAILDRGLARTRAGPDLYDAPDIRVHGGDQPV
jgi:hypothetical protein